MPFFGGKKAKKHLDSFPYCPPVPYLCGRIERAVLRAIKNRIFRALFLGIFLTSFFAVNTANAAETEEEHGAFNPTDLVMHHIADANEWHIVTWGEKHVAIPLPVIAWVPGEGLKMFSSSKLSHGEEHAGFTMHHGTLHHHEYEKGGLIDLITGKSGFYYDFSITKNVMTLLLTVGLMFFIFLTVARAYKRREGKAPKGLQSFFEPLIVFVRDQIAIPNIGEKKAPKYMPYLLTVFFFIWIGNMLGQIPLIGNPNLTGNIAITGALSIITLILTTAAGNKQYWGHIFTPHAPVFVWPILIPIEILGIFTKPFALMIRLFANITAGHIIILSLTSLIFVFGKAGASTGGGITGVAMAIPFVLFMSVIELLVAFLQAFIFTMLSALFIGLACKEHH